MKKRTHIHEKKMVRNEKKRHRNSMKHKRKTKRYVFAVLLEHWYTYMWMDRAVVLLAPYWLFYLLLGIWLPCIHMCFSMCRDWTLKIYRYSYMICGEIAWNQIIIPLLIRFHFQCVSTSFRSYLLKHIHILASKRWMNFKCMSFYGKTLFYVEFLLLQC